MRNLGSKSLDPITNNETYYSVDNKLRLLHGQHWPMPSSSSSSTSFYVHQPMSSIYSNGGDSNSEYKHQTMDLNHGAHQELGGKIKRICVYSILF